MYCHLVGLSCRNGRSAWVSGELVENASAAQYFSSGAQKSLPSPSTYAFPFCVMIALTRSGMSHGDAEHSGRLHEILIC